MQENLLTAYIAIHDFELFQNFDFYTQVYDGMNSPSEGVSVFSGKKLNREEYEKKKEEYEKLIQEFCLTPEGTFAPMEEDTKLSNIFEDDHYSISLKKLNEISKFEIKAFKIKYKDLIAFLDKNAISYEVEFGLFNATWMYT